MLAGPVFFFYCLEMAVRLCVCATYWHSINIKPDLNAITLKMTVLGRMKVSRIDPVFFSLTLGPFIGVTGWVVFQTNEVASFEDGDLLDSFVKVRLKLRCRLWQNHRFNTLVYHCHCWGILSLLCASEIMLPLLYAFGLSLCYAFKLKYMRRRPQRVMWTDYSFKNNDPFEWLVIRSVDESTYFDLETEKKNGSNNYQSLISCYVLVFRDIFQRPAREPYGQNLCWTCFCCQNTTHLLITYCSFNHELSSIPQQWQRKWRYKVVF